MGVQVSYYSNYVVQKKLPKWHVFFSLRVQQLMVSGDLCLGLGTRFTSAPRALSSGTPSHLGHDREEGGSMVGYRSTSDQTKPHKLKPLLLSHQLKSYRPQQSMWSNLTSMHQAYRHFLLYRGPLQRVPTKRMPSLSGRQWWGGNNIQSIKLQLSILLLFFFNDKINQNESMLIVKYLGNIEK